MDDQQFKTALAFERQWRAHLDEPRLARLRDVERKGMEVEASVATHAAPLKFTINVWTTTRRLLAVSDPAPFPAGDDQIRKMFDQAVGRSIHDSRY